MAIYGVGGKSFKYIRQKLHDFLCRNNMQQLLNNNNSTS